MNRYLASLDKITSARRSLARTADIIEPVSDYVPSKVSKVVASAKNAVPDSVPDSASTIIGAAAGAFLWKNHRVLGLISGASIGRNVPALLESGKRLDAICNMGITAGGVLGSMAIPKHPLWGFGIGWLVAGTAVFASKLR